MNAKHQFKYTYSDNDLEDHSPVEITFDIPTGAATITQMLNNFECYLRACGYVFDGYLEVVKEESYNVPNITDELDGTLYEFKDKADFDKENAWSNEECCNDACCNDLDSAPRCSEYDEDDGCPTMEEKYGSMADFDKECGCKTTSSPLENDEDEDGPTFHDTLSIAICEADKKLKEVTKNKWVHGMCNPPADDAKEHVENYKSASKKFMQIAIDAMSKW
jgi:hypothetical protein